MKRRIIAGVAALAAVVGSVLVVAQPAFAATCPYPYVCFFNGSTITGKFKVVTYPNYQPISGTSMYSTVVQNTRNDDVAWIRYRYPDGRTNYLCIENNLAIDFSVAMALGYRLTGVAISSAPDC